MTDKQVCRHSIYAEGIDPQSGGLIKYYACEFTENRLGWCPVMGYLLWLATEHGWNLENDAVPIEYSQCLIQDRMQADGVTAIGMFPFGIKVGLYSPLLYRQNINLQEIYSKLKLPTNS